MPIIVNGNELDDLTYNGVELDVVTCNGEIVWERVVPPEYLNYTALDKDGNYEGSVAYDGTVAAYAVGKPVINWRTYPKVEPTPTTQEEYVGKYYYLRSGYNLISPTPTTAEEYIGYYIITETPYNGQIIYGYTLITNDNIDTQISNGYLIVGETKRYSKAETYDRDVELELDVVVDAGTYTEITTSNIDKIIIGETPCYDRVQTEIKEEVMEETISYPGSSGFNSDYFGRDMTSDEFGGPPSGIVPEIIEIPSRYKGKPVVEIILSAFDGGNPTAQQPSYRAGSAIRKVIFNENLKKISNFAFSNCYRMGTFFEEIIPTPTTQEEYMNNYYKVSVGSYSQITTDSLFTNGTIIIGETPCYKYTYTDLILPQSLKILGTGSFEITSYASGMIPENVENVGVGVFYSPQAIRYAIGPDKFIIDCRAKNSTYESNNNYGALDSTTTDGVVLFRSSVETLSGTLFKAAVPRTWVFYHNVNQEINLDITAPKSAIEISIYTDNEIVKNYDWASKNYTVTFYPLSDYVGG